MSRQKSTVHAPGPATFELHTLGWRSFQDLCAAVLREVWGQSVQPFADTNDAGRDGAFYGMWRGTARSSDLPNGPFVLQCKFMARRDQTLSPSSIEDELAKIRKLVDRGLCESYVLLTNTPAVDRCVPWSWGWPQRTVWVELGSARAEAASCWPCPGGPGLRAGEPCLLRCLGLRPRRRVLQPVRRPAQRLAG